MAQTTSEIRKGRAAEYRARAEDALVQAEACALESVRRRLEASATVWIELAEAAERRRAPIGRA